MKKVAIITDSNSGFTIAASSKIENLFVLPMPFNIEGKEYFEEIDLTQDKFFELLQNDVNISTSQPAVGSVLSLWKKVLKDFDQIVHIPMSSGLSASCETATMLAQDFDGRVAVVNNQRISVTQYQSVLDALELAKEGKDAFEIKEYLENDKFNSSIYICVDTLKYLKRGGRVTPAGAALGELLKIKPVLQIQGDKLDAFAKVIGLKKAKLVMIDQMKKDLESRFHATPEEYQLAIAYTKGNEEFLERYIEDVKASFPGYELIIQPLSLSVACHIGGGSFALAVAHKYKK